MVLATGPDLTDLCSFGHQLVPGSDPITLPVIEGDTGRQIGEETKLLRRHAPYGSARSVGRTDPLKLVAYPCAHALPEAEVSPEDLPEPRYRGGSYGRAHWLTYTSVLTGNIPHLEAKCPVCLGQPAPDWRS